MIENSIIRRAVEDLIFYRWETTKFVKVVGLSLIGASVGAVMGAITIKDDPNNTIEEKEN